MKKILMIDDEVELLDVFGMFLNDELKEVTFLKADNGNAGLDIAEKERPDIIVLDMKLGSAPEGVEVLRRLKSILPHTRVIVWAGYSHPEVDAELQKLGVYSFVEKPV